MDIDIMMHNLEQQLLADAVEHLDFRYESLSQIGRDDLEHLARMLYARIIIAEEDIDELAELYTAWIDRHPVFSEEPDEDERDPDIFWHDMFMEACDKLLYQPETPDDTGEIH